MRSIHCCFAQFSVSIIILPDDGVRKGEGSRNGVMEGDRDFNGFGHQVLDLAKHGEIVLGLDVVGIGGVQACHKGTQRGDTDSFADS